MQKCVKCKKKMVGENQMMCPDCKSQAAGAKPGKGESGKPNPFGK